MAETRAVKAIAGIVFVLVVAATGALAQSRLASIPGVVVEATATPIRWLGLIPLQTVQFEIAIYVDRNVRAFSAIDYECLFVDTAGGEVGLASRGAAARESFTAMENGWLVSRTHEELGNHGPTAIRCRATKLEK